MQGFTPFNSPFALSVLVPVILVAALWTIVLKGFALWYSARGSQKGWFVALLILNTVGILELIYLLWFRPKAAESEPKPEHVSSPAA